MNLKFIKVFSMKIDRFLLIFFLCANIVILAISAIPSSSSVEPEIYQFVNLFVKTWNEHRPEKLNELWADNGDLINPAGEWEKGKANVLRILRREQQGILSKSQMRQEITNIRLLSPTMAWVDANVLLNVPGIPENLDHHIVYLLEKQNGQWRILAARPYQFLELHLGLQESPHAYQQKFQENLKK